MTAIIAAIANLKGGVGKSTTTVMLADSLAYFYGLNVCVVDLDAQANSSQMLLTEHGVHQAYEQGKGATHMLANFIKKDAPNVSNYIMPNAVTLEELRIAEDQDERRGWISSLPSHPHLRLQEMGLEEDWYANGGTPTTLSKSLADYFTIGFDVLRNFYDVILLDCPPHLSPLARAGLQISDVFITPTIADAVSTWGTKQFSDWITANIAKDLAKRHFVVISRFRNTSYARQIASELQDVYMKDRWFGPKIPESVHVLNAMERPAPDSYNTFRGKYGGVKGDVRRLAERFVDFLGPRTEFKWQKIRD